MLQEVLQGPRATAVATSGIGQDNDFRGIRIVQATLVLPPPSNTVNRKLWGIINRIGHRDAIRLGEEIVVID